MNRLNSKMICRRLVQRKERKDQSYHGIADTSNTLLSAAKWIFLGKPTRWAFTYPTLWLQLWRHHGGISGCCMVHHWPTTAFATEEHTMEEHKKAAVTRSEADQNEIAQSHSETVHIYQELVLSYRFNLAKNQKWLIHLFVVSIVLIIFILLYDVLTLGIGYIGR